MSDENPGTVEEAVWERLRELLYEGVSPHGVSWSGNETDTDIVEVVKFWLNEATGGTAFNTGKPKVEQVRGVLQNDVLYRTYGQGQPVYERYKFGFTPWREVSES